jgi:predicted dehydrogenase
VDGSGVELARTPGRDVAARKAPASVIGIAVVGYGYWGPNLVRNFSEVEGARVVLGCDRDPERLRRLQARYPAVATTTEFAEVLRHPEVDAVALATPVGTHYEFARRALEHGKHVLVEKPLATRVADAEHLVELAAKRELSLMVNHTFIYTGAVRAMKAMVDAGELGDLYYFDSVRINLGLVQRDVNVLWDLAPHDVAILEHLVAEPPVSVCANGACHLGAGLENVAYLTVYFQSGLIAHFHNNWLAPVKIRTVLVGGSRKMVVYDDLQASEKVKVYDRGVEMTDVEDVHRARIAYRLGDMWAPRLDETEALRNVAAEFTDAVATRRRPLTDGISGLNVVRILEAAEMSIKHRGREVKL